MTVKVSLGFAKLADTELDNFAQGVIGAMPSLPVSAAHPAPLTQVQVQTGRQDFTAAIAAAQTGGPAHTAAKNNSRQAFLGMLRQHALHVQMICNDDPAIVLSSGFQLQSTNRARTKLEQPQKLAIKNGGSGQLIASVSPVKNTSMYEGRAKLADNGGAWLPSVFTGDSQHIVFDGLTRGKDYTVQVRALGGSTGQSDWSDPSSHMAM